MADFKIEKRFLSQDIQRIAGVDEAGRGALFGPVAAAAIVLPSGWISRPVKGWLRQVDDSKLLAPQKRRELARSILAEADAVAVGPATSREIDEKNIYWASLEAMRRAAASLEPAAGLPPCRWVQTQGMRVRLSPARDCRR